MFDENEQKIWPTRPVRSKSVCYQVIIAVVVPLGLVFG